MALFAACTRSPSAQQGSPTASVGETTLAIANVTAAEPIAKEAPLAPKAAEPSACPDGMVLVDGDYCPDVEQICLEWMDPPSSRYHLFRCARYAPSVCKSKERVHMRYCIDATERSEPDSGELH